MSKLKVMDLFSGIGGFSLGLERTGFFETSIFCEIEPFCQQVLMKHWPGVLIYNDIRKLNGEKFRGSIDIICGGYPCQPFSTAGQQKGHKDDRHLWPEMYRLIKEVRPAFILAENVTGHINLGLDQVLSDLEIAGYTTSTVIIPACAVNAYHRRDRVWILAHSKSDGGSGVTGKLQKENELEAIKRPKEQLRKFVDAGQSNGKAMANTTNNRRERRGENPERQRQTDKQEQSSEDLRSKPGRCGETMANATGKGLPQRGQTRQQESIEKRTAGLVGKSERYGSQDKPGEVITGMGRVVDGIPAWMDETIEPARVTDVVKNRANRLKSLGNSVVPAVVETLGYVIAAKLNDRL